MFESEQLRSEYYANARDSVSYVVLIVLALCIAYWFLVLAVETYLMATERSREKQLLANKRASAKAVGGAASPRASARRGAAFDTGKLDVAINPLMTGGSASSRRDLAANALSGDSDPAAALESLAAFSNAAPPLEMWRAFASSYQQQAAQTATLVAELAAAKAALSAGSTSGEAAGSTSRGGARAAYVPVAASGADGASPGGNGSRLKAYAFGR